MATSNATTNSRNYTTLYSASTGSVNPGTGYGNANVASFLAEGSDTGGNSIGNITAAGIISAQGNIQTDAYFIGTFIGNISGNVAAAGANTQVQYNNSGGLGASAAFTFNQVSNVLNIGGNVSANYYTGNGSQLTGLPATYGNANVAAFLPTYTGNLSGGNLALTGNAVITGGVTTSNNIVSGANIQAAGNIRTTGPSGNITGVDYAVANFFVGNGSLLTGVTSTYGNANVASFLPVFGGNANVTTVFSNTNLAMQGQDWVQMQYNPDGTPHDQTNIGTGSWFYLDGSGAVWESNTTGSLKSVILGNNGNISAQGNVTAPYYFGNGSQLTGLPATYSNANVVSLLANFGSNTITTTGNIVAGNVDLPATGKFFVGVAGLNSVIIQPADISVVSAFGTGRVSADYFQGDGSNLSGITGANVTGTVANATYATSAGTATTATTVTGAAQANITSVGTLTSLAVSGNVSAGNISTTGLISATGNITGNYFIGNGSLLTGIAAGYGNANVVANLAALGSNPISTTGNITGNYFIGNGSQLTGIAAGYGNANVAANLAAFGSNPISTTGNITGGNINATVVSVTGNVQAGNLRTTGLISATGNVTGNYFVGNGSALTGVTATPGGSNTQVQYNDTSAFAGNANFTFNNSTGNINLGNLVFSSGNATNLINTVAVPAGQPSNVFAYNNTQILIGNAWNGNSDQRNSLNNSGRGAKLTVWETIPVPNTGVRIGGLSVQPMATLTGNVSNNSTRLTGLVAVPALGGSASNYNLTAGQIFGVSTGFNIGQPNTTVALGNVNFTGTTAAKGVDVQNQVYAGSNLTNSVIVSASTFGNGNTTNVGALTIAFDGVPTTTPSNVFGVYLSGNTSSGILGSLTSSNVYRAATNYYFLYNNDNLAQNRMGSMRSMHSFNYVATSSAGALTVDKTNGQVQSITLTEAITSVTFSNFVTTASDGTTTDYQTDTVNLIIRQGATPYAVTMPTGTAYKYYAGNSTVSATANTVVQVTTTANFDPISSATQYLITISPAFS